MDGHEVKHWFSNKKYLLLFWLFEFPVLGGCSHFVQLETVPEQVKQGYSHF